MNRRVFSIVFILSVWYVSDTKYNYVVTTRTPKGLVFTNLENNIITMADKKHVLPAAVDTSSLCVIQREGYLIFKFRKVYRS